MMQSSAKNFSKFSVEEVRHVEPARPPVARRRPTLVVNAVGFGSHSIDALAACSGGPFANPGSLGWCSERLCALAVCFAAVSREEGALANLVVGEERRDLDHLPHRRPDAFIQAQRPRHMLACFRRPASRSCSGRWRTRVAAHVEIAASPFRCQKICPISGCVLAAATPSSRPSRASAPPPLPLRLAMSLKIERVTACRRRH